MNRRSLGIVLFCVGFSIMAGTMATSRMKPGRLESSAEATMYVFGLGGLLSVVGMSLVQKR